MKYDIVIGLEIHCEPNTKTKIFCPCPNGGASQPNQNVCPVCLGMPGALPVVSRAAIEKTIAAGLAFNCKINDITFFERKNYFYPDLPKAYQISQLERPICLGGHVDLSGGKRIRLNRIHLEEDAGKLTHDLVNAETLVDFNRGGVPLLEMVTEPDISCATEAVEFLEEVRSRYVYANISHARMEEGEMRCDVNISLKPKGSKKLGNRVELKNLNSFKMVARAIEYETKRQSALLDDAQTVAVETRKWNDAKMISTPMRSKEQAIDYRYFPDPDQYPIRITPENVASIGAQMPTLAHEYRARFTTELALPAYDADILTREKRVTQFYLDSLALLNEPKKVSNWLLTNILAKTQNSQILLTPVQFTDTIKLTDARKITRQNALVLLDELWNKPNLSAETTATKLKILGGVTPDQIRKTLTDLLAKNPSALADYTQTPDKVINFFMGQTMKATSGMADSVTTKNILMELLA